MGAPINDRLGIVRALLETAPDNVVRDLDAALKADTSAPLAPVRAMVRTELSDRNVRDVVLSPVAPLCSPRADGFKQALFPAGALSRAWRGLRELEPRAITVMVSNLTLTADDDNFPEEGDELCRAATIAIREGHEAMQPLIRYLEDFQPGASELFASYLELAPLARTGIRRLPTWLRNMTGEQAAAVRLLFKDADDIAADASPRLLEILLAQIPEPWRILRIISAMTNRGGDRYLSSSELAEFCERVLADIDRRVNLLRLFDLDGGVEAGHAASAALAAALNEILEFEECLDLNKEGPWGARILKVKGALSNLTEGYLKKSPKIVGEALPLQPVRIGGMNLRMEPRLEPGPDARLVRRAMASLSFFERCRATASQGGYGTIRAKAGEEITHRLDSYVEDILAMIHSGELDNLDHARAFIEVVADMVALAQDEKSAQIVRRRAAAA
jgi:hypothetical protein